MIISQISKWCLSRGNSLKKHMRSGRNQEYVNICTLSIWLDFPLVLIRFRTLLKWLSLQQNSQFSNAVGKRSADLNNSKWVSKWSQLSKAFASANPKMREGILTFYPIDASKRQKAKHQKVSSEDWKLKSLNNSINHSYLNYSSKW